MRNKTTRIGFALALFCAALAGLLISRAGPYATTGSRLVAKPIQPAAMNGPTGPTNTSTAFQNVAPTGKVLPNGVRVIQEDHHDVSPPLRDIPPAPFPTSARKEGPEGAPPNAFFPGVHINDPVVQNWFGPLAMPTPILTFEGMHMSQGCPGAPCIPPDTNGDVGPNNYIQTVNAAFEIWDKSGNVVQSNRAINTIFSGFGGPCEIEDDGDPIVNYDPISDRWVISQLTVVTPYMQCIAVSSTGDPTGTWYRYAFLESNTNLYDYPKIGVWPDAYYMTANVFDGTTYDYVGPSLMAFDRARMLQGLSATAVEFNPSPYYYAVLPADLDGSTLPPEGAPEPFISPAGSDATLHLWTMHVDFANPAISHLNGPANLNGAPFDPNLCNYSLNCIPQPGVPSTSYLDSLASIPMFRLAYRRFPDHESLVTNMAVDTDGTDHAGVRWYEIRDPNGSPYIYQQGTYAPDSDNRWVGSIAIDHDGNIALGYSVSSSITYPSIRYTGRLATDPPGEMPQGEATLMPGGGSQQDSHDRWGDYSNLTVDPSDDCTFWYTNEYYPVSSNRSWNTRIGKFKFPGCGQPEATPTGTPPTATPTVPPTNTPLPAPNCTNYAVTTGTGTIVAGTTDIGNHCDDCTTLISLPFPVTLYERTFTSAYVSSNGELEYSSSDYNSYNSCLPVPVIDYTVAGYWDDLCTLANCYGTPCDGCGVFTSVSGAAPNRILNIEWRAQLLSDGSMMNFEIRLYESQVGGLNRFDIQYGGSVGQGGTGATVGVQRDLTQYTQFACNTSIITANMLLTFTAPDCSQATASPTSTSTPTNTDTPTDTNTPAETTTIQPSPTTSAGSPTPTECTLGFSDVPPGSTFYPYIHCLACLGIINGYPCGGPGEPCNPTNDPYFRPGNNVTRGQFAKIAANSAGFVDPPGAQQYEDVVPGSTFYDFIWRLANRGLVSGYPCGEPGEPCGPTNLPYFRPNANITRGQIAKIDSNSAGYNDTPGTQQYEDVLPGSTFYDFIWRLANRGLVNGYPCGGAGEPCGPGNLPYFRPSADATRGQASKIVSNTFFPNCQTPANR